MERLIRHYKEYLQSQKPPPLTLHEGNTPLIHLETLSKELGIEPTRKIRKGLTKYSKTADVAVCERLLRR